MKKYFMMALMIAVCSVSAAGCGSQSDQEQTSVGIAADAYQVEDVQGTEEVSGKDSSDGQSSQTAADAANQGSTSADTDGNAAGNASSQTDGASITESEAETLLIQAFGEIDEYSGDRNVFTYEESVTVDGIDYYSYRWEDDNGNYFCNAFVKTDGTDILTGVYSNGKWEIGSDIGDDSWNDSGYDDDVDDDGEDYGEDYGVDDDQADDSGDDAGVMDDDANASGN